MKIDLNNIQWREFSVIKLFKVERGNRLIINDRVKGNTPLVTAGFKNEGVADLIGNEKQKFYINAVTIDMFGNVFYRGYKFMCDDNIHILTNSKITKYSGLFICNSIKQTTENIFSYGKQFRLKTIEKLKIFLPANKNSEPDYTFMEQYMLQIENEKLLNYKNHTTKRIRQIQDFKQVEPLAKKSWGEFFIEDIFHINAGKRLTKADMIKGETPFIGASDSNNGITNFVSNTNSSLDSNILGVNYNGSVVENFYHPYKAIFSDDVKRLGLKEVEGNELLYLFIKTMILKQKSKFQYAYKFNEARMLRQKLLFPTNNKGKIDYDYMENYIKKIEYEKLTKYIERKTTNA